MMFDFTEIERLIYFPDNKKTNRFENNSEHSFSLAMATWFLCESFPYLNKDIAIRYALVHDIVELHAGDVMAIKRTPEEEQKKQSKEHVAFKQIQKDWKDFSGMIDAIEQYEKRSDPESKFVYALDKIMPILLCMLSDGKTWKHHKFTMKDIFEGKDAKIALSPEVNEIWKVIRVNLSKNKELFYQP